MFPRQSMVATLERAAAYTLRHRLSPSDASYVDPGQIPELRRKAVAGQHVLLDDLAAQLRSGALYGVGFRVGQHEPTTIPREWWGVATLDPEMNTAEGNGVTFSGLLIFEAPGPASAAVSVSDGGSPNLARATAWMLEHVTLASKRVDMIQRCREALEVTHRIAREAWGALPTELRGTRGQRKPK